MWLAQKIAWRCWQASRNPLRSSSWGIIQASKSSQVVQGNRCSTFPIIWPTWCWSDSFEIGAREQFEAHLQASVKVVKPRPKQGVFVPVAKRNSASHGELRRCQNSHVPRQEELNTQGAYSCSQICTGVATLQSVCIKKNSDFVWTGAGQHKTCQVLKANIYQYSILQASNIVWRLCPPCSSACSPGITPTGGSSTSAYPCKHTHIYII